MIKATICFPNDPSVGMLSEYYTMELPFEKKEDMDEFIDDDAPKGIEYVRRQIQTMYNNLHGDSLCRVWFDFETA